MRAFALATAVILAATPLYAQEASWAAAAEVRPRFEWGRSPFWTDASTSMRTRVELAGSVGPFLAVVAQVQDSRTWGEESSTTDRSADGLDMHQAYLELRRDGPTPVTVRVGRQAASLADDRYIGERPWSEVGQSFDALRVDLGDPARWRATALLSTLAERGRTAPGPDQDDATLLVLYVETPLAQAHVVRESGVVYRGFRDVSRTTLAGRLALARGRLSGAVDAAYQAGSQFAPAPGPGAMDIAASFLGARLGWTVGGVVQRVQAGLDWHSGDDDPYDGEHSAHHILYGSRHKFRGFLDLFSRPDADTGDRGLADVLVGTELAVGKGVRVDGHAFFTAAERPGEAREIGWELDVRAPFQMTRGLDLEAGYSIFLNRAAAVHMGLGGDGETHHWLYLMATASF